MRSPEFFKELGVTALGQILLPGAYSIWAIWRSTYERKTIHYQLRALKALAELNSNEISPEEFASLSGREILTVDVIDEYGIGSENQGGKFHLYEDGRIVREFYGEKGTAYEFVDSIPEDRVGGVRELDSIADGTPLEILEYLSLAAVVRKQGTKVIRKCIKKADFDALVRILKEEKGQMVLPGKKDGNGTGKLNSTKDIYKVLPKDVHQALEGYVQTHKYTAHFRGFEVKAQRSLSHMSDKQLLYSFKKGYSPKDGANDTIVLHHHEQKVEGPIIEMPSRYHDLGNKRQHPFGNSGGVGSGEARLEFNNWRKEYWKARYANEMIKRGIIE